MTCKSRQKDIMQSKFMFSFIEFDLQCHICLLAVAPAVAKEPAAATAEAPAGAEADTRAAGDGEARPPPAAQANSKEKTPMCLVNELARYNKVRTILIH